MSQSVQDAFNAFLARFAKLSTEEQTASANSVAAFLQQQAPVKAQTTSSTTTSSTSSSSSSSSGSVTGSKPSSHVAQQPGGNSSLNLFGGDQKSSDKDKSAFYAAGNKQNQSSIFDAPTSSGQTSVRVSNAPGGSSSISLGSDSKTTTSTTTSGSDDAFHKDLKTAIADKNPSFQNFFKQCAQGGRILTAAQLAAGLEGLLKEKAKSLGVSEQSITALFQKHFNKAEIGQSDFTKLFAQ